MLNYEYHIGVLGGGGQRASQWPRGQPNWALKPSWRARRGNRAAPAVVVFLM